MTEGKIVWSDQDGDLRKKKNQESGGEIDPTSLELHIRRLTSGKGRVILEITQLPNNKGWCKKLAKEIKKKMACGGAYKNDFIEVHSDNFEKLTNILESQNLKWKKTGG